MGRAGAKSRSGSDIMKEEEIMKKILSAVLVLTLALSLCAFAMAEGAMSYAD